MSKKDVLVVCPPTHPVLRNLIQLDDLAEIRVGNDTQALVQHAAQAEIVLFSGLTGESVNFEEVWRHAGDVRWIHTLSAGVEHVLIPELISSQVIVTNARGVFKRSLAEFAVLGALFHYKRVRRLIESQRAHRWDDFNVEWLRGKVMGIVGYGEIGRECALLAHAFGMRIFAVRRNAEHSANDLLVDQIFMPQELHRMLGDTDVLVAAAPLTKETRHMIGAPEFAAMKPSSIVINVGRGPVVDQEALTRALQEKKIAGAALDVFETEPLPADSPLWDLENVLVSPHCTDRTANPDWLDISMQLFIENFKRYIGGEPLLNIVDKKAGY